MCRRDHGLSWAEFCALTLPQLDALEERREIAIRHARFNAALITATIYNVNRGESKPLSAFDFIPGFDSDPVDEEKAELRRSVKHAIALAITDLPKTWSRAEVLAEKAKMVANMKRTGLEDAEEIFREVFPNL